jgi:hypothetical protein
MTAAFRESGAGIAVHKAEPFAVTERDHALRKGDSITFKGYKITVVEAGDFGDVVKVEKTS